ncbi:virion core protein, T7 gp14 family [Microvirga mediterraneensis]|uniref:Internal virion protein B n=1 Tax=Microvirga mediterraneensis TaxID=2754695 RepID=A0A838BUX3_9HYPH|nr:hypothetical protein [Microvirga mediterraneensis]MBA1159337.1 hypothetical protein [Microvirga mediterraneensis]
MCVAALPMIAMVSSLASAAVGAVGAIQQGNAAAASAKYNAAVNENNNVLAQRAAEDARKRGEQEAQEHNRRVSALRGKQTAAMAANGVDLTSGSPLNVTADTAQLGALDVLTIRNNTEREALGYEAQGMNFRAEANLNRMQAKSARQAGMIGAVGSVVSGFGQVADKWYKMGPSSIGKLT